MGCHELQGYLKVNSTEMEICVSARKVLVCYVHYTD